MQTTSTFQEKFMKHNPYLLAEYDGYKMYEHPRLGDEAPIYMLTPDNRLINTGYYDLGDFDIELCEELSNESD